MSDEINEWEKGLYSGTFMQGWELETPDENPVRFYEQNKPEKKERISRLLDFLDR